MTCRDIAEFYVRLNRELEHRTVRKFLERDLRNLVKIRDMRREMRLHVRDSSDRQIRMIKERLRAISF